MSRRHDLPENCEYVVLEWRGDCRICRDLEEMQDVVNRLVIAAGVPAEDVAVMMGDIYIPVWAAVRGVYAYHEMPEWVENWGWEEI